MHVRSHSRGGHCLSLACVRPVDRASAPHWAALIVTVTPAPLLDQNEVGQGSLGLS